MNNINTFSEAKRLISVWRPPAEFIDEMHADFPNFQVIDPREDCYIKYERKASTPGGFYFARYDDPWTIQMGWWGLYLGKKWRAQLTYHKHKSGNWFPFKDEQYSNDWLDWFRARQHDTGSTHSSGAMRQKMRAIFTLQVEEFIACANDKFEECCSLHREKAIASRAESYDEHEKAQHELEKEMKLIADGELLPVKSKF